MDIPKEFLSKEFLSQFKTGEDVTAFMKELHTRVYEQMLEAEMDNHLGYEKHSNQGDHSGNFIGSRFKPRWVNLLFRFLVIGKENLSLLLFPSINPAAYQSSVLSSLFMPKV